MVADPRGSSHLQFLAGCLHSFLVRFPGLMSATLPPSHSCLGSQGEYFKIQTGCWHFSCLKPLQVSHPISDKIQTLIQVSLHGLWGQDPVLPVQCIYPTVFFTLLLPFCPFSVTGNSQASHRAFASTIPTTWMPSLSSLLPSLVVPKVWSLDQQQQCYLGTY